MTSIRLSLILERFSYPITEEQTWGICYLTASELKSIPGPWIYTPDNILKANTFSEFSNRFPMEAVLFNRSGELQLDNKVISSRFATSDSGARYVILNVYNSYTFERKFIVAVSVQLIVILMDLVFLARIV